MTKRKLLTGASYPLGATCDADGVNFALFSAHATRVELCVYSSDGQREVARYDLPEVSNHVWHGYLPKAGAGTVYGYRVHGPYQPDRGHRFNPHKLVIDPYARSLVGKFVWNDCHYGYQLDDPESEQPDDRDNQQFMPKARVITEPTAAVRRHRRIPESDMVIYEAHAKGFTMLHPEIPEHERGTFAGLAHPKALEYLKSLGITSVELMPVNSFVTEPFLLEKGLRNYWGYNTLAFFAPHQDYQSGEDIFEVRRMVESIHDAGMEVILDIVFNHTAEGSRLGPTLSFRGIDNLSYYRLMPDDRRLYINDTGCGNTMNMTHPRVIQWVMDCLRYWVGVMGVDGFRFDLAPVLGRELHGFDQGSGFFDALQQDPLLAGTKFIAEPWDIGPGGYQLGHFPPGWSEWNDRYRDTVRQYWRGDPGILPDFARRVHGSSDLFEHSGRCPSASVNFVTSHDGYTLADLVSYKERHNEANGEDNRDGHRNNHSDNFGVEGSTDDTAINILRWRQQKNFLATNILSQGIPMILMGDEIGRTLQGNNNAYCQDNELNWFPWENISGQASQQKAFLAHLIDLRRRFFGFSMDQYIHESDSPEDPGMKWFNAAGEEMETRDWTERKLKTLGNLLSYIDPASGEREQFLLIFHAERDAISFDLPKVEGVRDWEVMFDTGLEGGIPSPDNCIVESRMRLFSCSSAMLLARHEAG